MKQNKNNTEKQPKKEKLESKQTTAQMQQTAMRAVSYTHLDVYKRQIIS